MNQILKDLRSYYRRIKTLCNRITFIDHVFLPIYFTIIVLFIFSLIWIVVNEPWEVSLVIGLVVIRLVLGDGRKGY